MDRLPSEARLGSVDPETFPPSTEKVHTASEVQRQQAQELMLPVHEMVLLQDFDYWAKKVLTEVAWAY